MKEHVSSAIKEQVSVVSKEFEERMNRFEAKFDRIFRAQLGKEPVVETGASSNTEKGILETPPLIISTVRPDLRKGVGIAPCNVAEVPELNRRENRNLNVGDLGYRGHLPK
jgi:hypothetical protein